MNENQLNQAGKYCVFQCCGETFAISALAIRNVTPVPELSPIPLTDRALAGLAYLHNEFLPVFDLSDFIGAGSKGRNNAQQMLIFNGDEGAWGILIDQVLGLESLEISFSGRRGHAKDWASVNGGSATFREHFVSVIQPNDLLSLVAGQLRGHWQAMNEPVAAAPSLDPQTA